FFFQAEDGIRDFHVTGVQTCALPISARRRRPSVRLWQAIQWLPLCLSLRWFWRRNLFPGGYSARNRAMTTDRLVGKRDEDKNDRADDEQEDPDVKQQGARRWNLPDYRNVQITAIGRQEGIAEEPGAQPGARGEEQPGTHPAQGQHTQ